MMVVVPRLPQSAPRRPATLAERRALAHPDRLRIVRLTFDQAFTNKQLAARLGRDPGTIYHHVRTLVATGFLAAEAPRRGARGAREVPYRSTGKSWTLDLGVPGDDAVSAVVGALQAELLEAPAEHRRWTRLALRLDSEQRERLETRIGELLDEVVSWEPAPDGEPYALFVAWHPRPS